VSFFFLRLVRSGGDVLLKHPVFLACLCKSSDNTLHGTKSLVECLRSFDGKRGWSLFGRMDGFQKTATKHVGFVTMLRHVLLQCAQRRVLVCGQCVASCAMKMDACRRSCKRSPAASRRSGDDADLDSSPLHRIWPDWCMCGCCIKSVCGQWSGGLSDGGLSRKAVRDCCCS
jgi:hypothetical protein